MKYSKKKERGHLYSKSQGVFNSIIDIWDFDIGKKKKKTKEEKQRKKRENVKKKREKKMIRKMQNNSMLKSLQ